MTKRLRAQWTLPRAGDRRKQLSRTHYGTKREAQRALAALVAKVSEGKITSTAKTLGQLLDSWIEHVEGSLSPTTVREYRRLTERLIKPDLGRLRLGRITTKQLDDYYAMLTKGREINPPANVDVKRMLELADEDDPEYGELLRVLTATGARRGEVSGCVGPTSTVAVVGLCRKSVPRRRHVSVPSMVA